MIFRDRVRELRANPKNWRVHPEAQRSAMRAVLSEIGYAGALVAREDEAGQLVLIDGHLRHEETPNEIVPVLVVDVTEEEADKLLALFDPLRGMAETDDAKLAELLAEVETDDPALQDLLDSLAVDPATPREPTEFRAIDVQPPPPMTWVLLGIPTVRFGEVNDLVEQLATVPGILLESTSNNG